VSGPSYSAYWCLSQTPFVKELADDQLWSPPSKELIVDGLCEAAEDRACSVLVGEPGVGKTCVLRSVRHRLPATRFRLTYCHNATLGKRDFYRQLCVALNLGSSATAASVFYTISTHVQQLAQERVHPLFLLDEAHLLHPDMLDHLHILLNYDWDSRPLLSLVLVGLPELMDRLELRRNRSLLSRIERRFVLTALTEDDTADYLKMRLRLAGCERDLFARDAVALIHERGGGALRDIDRLATAGLREGARQKKKAVDADSLERALRAEGRG
jgi:type II secretory pathway predicted ATPase ExeA